MRNVQHEIKLKTLGEEILHDEIICLILASYFMPIAGDFESWHDCGCDYLNAERVIRQYYDCAGCESITSQLRSFLALSLINIFWYTSVIPSLFSGWKVTSPTELEQIESVRQLRLKEFRERGDSTTFSDD